MWQSACSACQIVKSALVDRLGPIPQSNRAHIIKTTNESMKIVVNGADIQNEEKNWLLDKWQVASGKLGLLVLAAIGVATWHMAHKVCMVICV